MRDLLLRVRSVRKATPSSSVVCVDLDGASFPYRAGQVASLRPEGAGDRIPYSIASAPEETAADSTIQFLIKLDSGGRWGDHFEPDKALKDKGYAKGRWDIIASHGLNAFAISSEYSWQTCLLFSSLTQTLTFDPSGSDKGGRQNIPGYGGSDGTRQKFASKERDGESGLDYFGARYY